MEVYGPGEAPYAIALYAVSGVCGPILGPVCPFLLLLCMIIKSTNPRSRIFGTLAMFVPSHLYALVMVANSHSERWHTWTASLWLLSGITAFTTLFIFFLLPETLPSNILLRRAQRLRTQTGNSLYRSQSEMDISTTNFGTMILKQTVNDFRISCMDPVIIFVNIHTMLIYGILYLWFEFFPFGKTIQSNSATFTP